MYSGADCGEISLHTVLTLTKGAKVTASTSVDLGAKLPCVRWFVMIGASDECSVVDAAKSVGLLAEKVNGRKHPVGLQAELHPSHAKRALGNHPTSRTQLHGLRRPGTTKQCRCPCTKAFSNANSRHHRPRAKSHPLSSDLQTLLWPRRSCSRPSPRAGHPRNHHRLRAGHPRASSARPAASDHSQ